MGNESIIQFIDNPENQSQDNISNIKIFLQDITDEKQKKLIEDTLNNSHDLAEKFDLYLKDISNVKKIKLKNKLKECNNTEEVQKIIEVLLSEETWYQVWYHEIENNSLIQRETTEKKQETTEKEQETYKKEQETYKKEQETIENASWLKEIEVAISARQELVNKIPDLDKKTNKDSELYQATKSEFEQSWIIQQLKDSNHDEDFINNYILVHTTLKELKSNENYKNVNISFFEKAVKNLDNACNIPDTKFNDFSREKITKTRTELFDADIWNHSLKEAKKTNKESAIHQKTYNEIFALDENKNRDTELIEKYWKFIEDDNIKDLVKKYENNELSEQDNDTLRKWLKNIKENIDNQTKDLIEEMCLIAPIQWIFACIWPELGNNFNLNKSREISNENWEITITWHIDWIPFSLHHDTNNPDARLQTSSALTKIDNNKFEIWEKFKDSPYKLPTNWDIFAIAISCLTHWDVTSTENATKYFQALQEKISEKIEKELYKNAKYANHYIKDKIKWEKISNQYLNLLWEIKESPIKWDIEQSNSKLYNFVDLIDSSSYISTISEKEDISHCIGSIKDVISQYWKLNKQSNRYPTIIRHFLMDKTILENTQKILNWYNIQWDSILDLFWYYTEQNSWIKTINFKQLKKDLEWKEWQESLVASNRQDNMERKYADTNLDNELKNIV